MKNKFFISYNLLFANTFSRSFQVFIPMAEIPAGSFYMGSDGLGEDFDEALSIR